MNQDAHSHPPVNTKKVAIIGLFLLAGFALITWLMMLSMEEDMKQSEMDEFGLNLKRAVIQEMAVQKDCPRLRLTTLELHTPIEDEQGNTLLTGLVAGCEAAWLFNAKCPDLTATQCEITFTPTEWKDDGKALGRLEL